MQLITKDEFIDILRGMGYECIYELNMPIVLVHDDSEYREAKKDISKIAQKYGYNFSWGIRLKRQIDTTE